MEKQVKEEEDNNLEMSKIESAEEKGDISATIDPKKLGLIKKDKKLDAIISDRSFQCDQCSKTFKSKPNLAGHKHKVHGPKKECPICKKSCSTASYLKRHVAAVHDKVKPYECDQCG